MERGTTVAKKVPNGRSVEASQPMAMATARMIAGNMRQSRILKSILDVGLLHCYGFVSL